MLSLLKKHHFILFLTIFLTITLDARVQQGTGVTISGDSTNDRLSIPIESCGANQRPIQGKNNQCLPTSESNAQVISLQETKHLNGKITGQGTEEYSVEVPVIHMTNYACANINDKVTIEAVVSSVQDGISTTVWEKDGSVVSLDASFEYTPTTLGTELYRFKAINSAGRSMQETLALTIIDPNDGISDDEQCEDIELLKLSISKVPFAFENIEGYVEGETDKDSFIGEIFETKGLNYSPDKLLFRLLVTLLLFVFYF